MTFSFYSIYVSRALDLQKLPKIQNLKFLFQKKRRKKFPEKLFIVVMAFMKNTVLMRKKLNRENKKNRNKNEEL